VKHTHVLIQGPNWQLLSTAGSYQSAELSAAMEASANDVAKAAASTLQAQGSLDQEVILAVNDAHALATVLQHQGRRGRQTTAMIYQLEESLPLSAEEMVCDFIMFRRDALAVAADVNYLQPLLEALSRHGIRIRSITSQSLLAIQGCDHESFGRGMPLVIWRCEDHLNCFVLQDGRPKIWRRISANADSASREIAWLRHSIPDITTIVAVNCDSTTVAKECAPGLEVTNLEIDPLESIGKAARRIVSGREAPWIELRRHPLGEFDPLFAARGRLRVLAASMAFLVVCVLGALGVQTHQNEQIAEQYYQKQVALFQELFPGQTVPTGMRSRLESEHRKLTALTGKAQGMPQMESAIHTLFRATSPLPKDLRFRILEMRIDNTGLYIDGEVREHGDADLIATRLRDAGFEIAPPRTERLADRGVGYVVSGQIAAKTTTKPEKAP
jgi:hypothetical protein